MRQVCQDWRAAFREYPADIVFGVCNNTDLLSKILPSMRHLVLVNYIPDPDILQPLLQCAHLTHLQLCEDTWEDVNLRLDMRHVPRSVEVLQFGGLSVNAAYLTGLQCLHVKDLSCRNIIFEGGSLWSLLDLLPDLKVSKDTCK